MNFQILKNKKMRLILSTEIYEDIESHVIVLLKLCSQATGRIEFSVKQRRIYLDLTWTPTEERLGEFGVKSYRSETLLGTVIKD